MNLKQIIYSLFFLIGCNSFSVFATSTGDMLAYELLRARQMCERSHPRRVCLEMEQMRYKELQEGSEKKVKLGIMSGIETVVRKSNGNGVTGKMRNFKL